MKISVEIESVEELKSLLGWRDALRDRVAELERQPLKFSLQALARSVTDGVTSLTPDQAVKVRSLIEKPD